MGTERDSLRRVTDRDLLLIGAPESKTAQRAKAGDFDLACRMARLCPRGMSFHEFFFANKTGSMRPETTGGDACHDVNS